MPFLKTVLLLIAVGIALFTHQTTSVPTPFPGHEKKPFRLSIQRWVSPDCGKGPKALWPRRTIHNRQCVSLVSSPQRPQMFGSLKPKWLKQWENDRLFMFGECRLKVWSQPRCAGYQLGLVSNFTVDNVCHSVEDEKELVEHGAKGISLSLWCDYGEPVDPMEKDIRFWT